MLPDKPAGRDPAADLVNDPDPPAHTEAPDLNHCVEGARVWMTPGRTYQFTGIRTNPDGPPDLYAGLFDDIEAAAAYVYDAGVAGVDAYFTINSPCAGAGAGLPVNDITFAGRGQCAGDGDFDAVEKILLDLDTVRPSKTAATDSERATGIERAYEIRRHLAGLGFPPPIVQATPNGAALLLRVNLQTPETATVRQFLGATAARFDDDRVKVDQVVYNPARLGRPAGSVGHKGRATAERPHRVCRLLCAGDPAAVVPRNLIEKVAAEAPAPPRGGTSGGTRGSALPARGGGGQMSPRDLDRFIARHVPDADGPHPWGDGGRKWVLPVCPWNPGHDDRAAFVVQLRGGRLQAGCHHDGCSGRGWRDLVVQFPAYLAEQLRRRAV